ncbi:hypothetical protein HPB52_020712 [Rhipicephalus sanguineus]|uniref:Uncharacterized protein n=1 Tax=Rhipicephalus sanguineus TaxID=34632 RepID=A0A9D4T0H0_RHISA|nr:hypothetical protein HPB52_020712 [Rhipicephalus sanguineus]
MRPRSMPTHIVADGEMEKSVAVPQGFLTEATAPVKVTVRTDNVADHYNVEPRPFASTRGSQSKVPVKQQKIWNGLERDPESSCEV